MLKGEQEKSTDKIKRVAAKFWKRTNSLEDRLRKIEANVEELRIEFGKLKI